VRGPERSGDERRGERGRDRDNDDEFLVNAHAAEMNSRA
jgi:hypothetical protein